MFLWIFRINTFLHCRFHNTWHFQMLNLACEYQIFNTNSPIRGNTRWNFIVYLSHFDESRLVFQSHSAMGRHSILFSRNPFIWRKSIWRLNGLMSLWQMNFIDETVNILSEKLQTSLYFARKEMDGLTTQRLRKYNFLFIMVVSYYFRVSSISCPLLQWGLLFHILVFVRFFDFYVEARIRYTCRIRVISDFCRPDEKNPYFPLLCNSTIMLIDSHLTLFRF